MARDCEAVDVNVAVKGERIVDLRGREGRREGGRIFRSNYDGNIRYDRMRQNFIQAVLLPSIPFLPTYLPAAAPP